MCVCLCVWVKSSGVGSSPRWEAWRSTIRGSVAGEPVIPQDLVWIPLLSVGLRAPGGDTDGQHVEGKRQGYDLLPCGEKSTVPLWWDQNWIKAALNAIQIFRWCPRNAVSISCLTSSKARPSIHFSSAWATIIALPPCPSPPHHGATFFRSEPPQCWLCSCFALGRKWTPCRQHQ